MPSVFPSSVGVGGWRRCAPKDLRLRPGSKNFSYPLQQPAPCELPSLGEPVYQSPEGFVGSSPTMTAQLLLAAYSQGLFPWTEAPVRWFCPHPRAVLTPQSTHLPRNLGKLCRRAGFEVSFDQDFLGVMRSCQAAHQQAGQWIGPAFLHSYGALHALGFAHSVEVWQHHTLVGGLYGVHLGNLFAGESMFGNANNAGKAAFAGLLYELDAQGVDLVDAQVLNENSAALGAVEVARTVYLRMLKILVPPQRPLVPRAWGRCAARQGPNTAS